MGNSVDHPAHYKRKNSIECIEEMELIFGREAVKIFCLLNVWKYRYRASNKNGEEDLEKSDWYLKKYKELDEKDGNINLKSIKPLNFPFDKDFTPITPWWDKDWYGTRSWWDVVTCNAINTATSNPGKSE